MNAAMKARIRQETQRFGTFPLWKSSSASGSRGRTQSAARGQYHSLLSSLERQHRAVVFVGTMPRDFGLRIAMTMISLRGGPAVAPEPQPVIITASRATPPWSAVIAVDGIPLDPEGSATFTFERS